MKVVILFGCFSNLLSLNCVEIDHQQKNILNCQSIGMVLIQSMALCPISSASEIRCSSLEARTQPVAHFYIYTFYVQID